MLVVSAGTMKSSTYLPDRGDIVWINLDPRVGHEQSGHRPALVLSPQLFSARTGLAIICPITSRIRGLSMERDLNGTSTKGAILPIQVRSVDFTTRRIKFIEKARKQIVDDVAKKVSLIIGAS